MLEEQPTVRALEDDPGGTLPEQLPAPPTLPRWVNIPPVALLVGVVLLLLTLALFTVQATNETQNEMIFNPTATPEPCYFSAREDSNVRAGPGWAYGRLWILPDGEQAMIAGKNEEGWLYMDGEGWLPPAGATLQPLADCARLPQISTPPVIEDTLPVPEQIGGWFSLLEETFATNANGWIGLESSQPAALLRGELYLPEARTLFIPAESDNYHALETLYMAFQGRWSGQGGEVVLAWHMGAESRYQAVWRQDGNLTVYQVAETGNQMLFEGVGIVPGEGQFSGAILVQRGQVALLVNGQAMGEVMLPVNGQGLYALGGGGGAVISRLEIRVDSLALP